GVLRGGLPVVAVSAGRDQREHLGTVGRDLAREIVHRIEARYDEKLPVGRRSLLAGRQDEDGEEARGPPHAGRPTEVRVSAARRRSMRPKPHTTVAPVGVSRETEAIMARTLTTVPKLQAMARRRGT